MKFKSAIDWWFYAVFGFVVVVPFRIWFAVPGFESSLVAAALLIPVFVGLGLPIWMLVSTYYIVSDDDLIIRSGPFKWRVSIPTIQSITPTRSPLSSPALSLNRLEIRYGVGKVVLVSPINHQEFIDALSN